MRRTLEERVAMSLRQEALSLFRRLGANRCDACGKTPAHKIVEITVPQEGTMVFSLCRGCLENGTGRELELSQFIISKELADLTNGKFSSEFLASLQTTGGVQ